MKRKLENLHGASENTLAFRKSEIRNPNVNIRFSFSTSLPLILGNTYFDSYSSNNILLVTK